MDGSERKVILQFLHTLRETATKDLIVDVFLHGGCFKLYQLLKMMFPEAEPWHDPIEGHIYTEIGGRFYDITGEHEKDDNWERYSEWNDHVKDTCDKWRYEW